VRQPQRNPAPSTAASTLPAVPMPMEGESAAPACVDPLLASAALFQRYSGERAVSGFIAASRLFHADTAGLRGMGGNQWSARLRRGQSPSWTS
jgi:hypothetical protein